MDRTETPIGRGRATVQIPQWSLARLLAFRFCFLYLGLYCLTQGMLATLFVIPNFAHAIFLPALMTLWPMRQIIFWTAANVFHISHPLVYVGSGSGDKTFDWIAVFCLFAIAGLAAGVWSVLDRRPADYTRLYKYFRLFLRFVLASEMLLYGTIKVLPIQIHFPFLTRWVEPFGNFTGMGVLWNSVGASPVYETLTGFAETLGGVLLFMPQTALLGALLCLADLTEVFILNVTYDVPVKLFSFHLLLVALFILAPELPRLVAFLSNRAIGPSTQGQVFRTKRANNVALAVQIGLGIYLLGTYAYLADTAWHNGRDRRARAEFYGIWNVDELSIDGQLRPPILTDNARWRRLIFEDQATVNFEGMDESFVGYNAALNRSANTFALTKPSDKNWKAQFTYQRPAHNELILDGDMDDHRIHMLLRLVDPSVFPLANQKFHWIAEYPFDNMAARR